MLTPQNAWLPRCATCHLPPPPPQRVREDRRKAPSPPPPSHGAYLQADQSRFGNPSHDSIRSETALAPCSFATMERKPEPLPTSTTVRLVKSGMFSASNREYGDTGPTSSRRANCTLCRPIW